MDQWIFYGITVKNAFLSHNLYKSHLYCFPLSSSTDEGPAVHMSSVCVGLEQLRAPQWGAPAVQGPGGHLPGAALSK